MPRRPAIPARPVRHSRSSIRAIVCREETSSVQWPHCQATSERSSSSPARSGPRSASDSTTWSANSAFASIHGSTLARRTGPSRST